MTPEKLRITASILGGVGLVASVCVGMVIFGALSERATNSATPPSASSAAPTVALPAPDARGPTTPVEGQVSWTASPPGCVLVTLEGGQTFQLTGRAVSEHLGQVRAGTAAPQERLRLTGYIPPVGASVCGADRSFVAEQVTAVNK
jgi:hypothetical protein